MKFTAALATVCGLAMAGSHHVPFTHLELAQVERVSPSVGSQKMQFAQVAAEETDAEGVTHPDDRETESPILDRQASDKLNGLVSYQRFLDHRVNSLKTKYEEGDEAGNFTDYPENGLYNPNTHVCAFRFRWEQPFTPYTERYMIAVTHDCPDGLTPPIAGFRFIISLAGYDILAEGNRALVNSLFRDKFNPHPSTPVNDGLLTSDGTDSTITFELNRDDASTHNAFGILLPISYNALENDSEDTDGKWTYAYAILDAAPYSL